ncbi:MAG TPA: hypothetical protein VL172_08570 [Kofleriaceae bacterium]|nr:hypothetical protein [Kofleriaceae bacterium]
MRAAVLSLLLAAAAPAAHAGELSIGAGFARASSGPDPGLPLELGWAHDLGPHTQLVVRGELALNAGGDPGDSVMKGAAVGLDVGLRRLRRSSSATFSAALALGPRLYFEPGIGGAARLTAAAHLPLDPRWWLTLALATELGAARMGDEAPEFLFQARVDAILAAAVRF